MNWTSFDTWIVVVGALTAVACALPGCFLVLRKMSMMGDAISHAVLPGIAVGFLLTGTRVTAYDVVLHYKELVDSGNTKKYERDVKKQNEVEIQQQR